MLFIVTFCLRTKSCCSKISKDADAAIAFDNCGMKWQRGSSSLAPSASPGTFASSSPVRFTKPCVVRLRNMGYRSNPSHVRLLSRHLLHHGCWRSHCLVLVQWSFDIRKLNYLLLAPPAGDAAFGSPRNLRPITLVSFPSPWEAKLNLLDNSSGATALRV